MAPFRLPSPERALPNVAAAMRATRLTPDVARAGSTLHGRVRSVHRAAIYVDVTRRDDVLTIAVDDVGGTPGSILVRPEADLRTLGIEPEMPFRPTVDGWVIPDACVSVASAAARLWSPRLPRAARVNSRQTRSLVAAAIDLGRDLAAELAPSAGLGPLLRRSDHPSSGAWARKAGLHIDRIGWALRADDRASILGEAVELIGLGPGLTPSGDDFLVGLLAGMEAMAHPLRPALATAVAYAAPARTTAIAAAALIHAARGEYAERLTDVLVAMVDPEHGRLRQAVERAMAYGATSGADTLVGLFAAIDIGLSLADRSRTAA